MDELRVIISAPLEPELVERISAADPRIKVNYRPDLLLPLRHSGDYIGDTSFQMTDEQESEFQQYIRDGQVMLGVPRGRSSAFRSAIEDNPDLIWVHTYAAGGGAQVKAAKLSDQDLERVIFTTSAGAHAESLTEFALLGALAGLKDLPRLQRQQRAREWAARWPSNQLSDATVVIVGMGHIGREMAERFLAFGSTVVGVNRSLREVPGVEMHTIDELEEQAARADVLVNCLPGAVGTENLINAEVLAALPAGATFVSVGRGRCVDEEALIAGLQAGQIGFAAMDVFAVEPLPQDSPLWDLPNVLISPHTMALTKNESARIVEIFLQNALALLEGEPMKNVVDKVLFY